MSCDCDCEYPVAFTEKTRRARKTRRCCECGEAIRPGDSYVHSSGIWDGRPDSFSECVDCNAWKHSFMRHPNGCDCVAFGQLWSEVAEFTREVLEYDDETGEPVPWARPIREPWLQVEAP